MGGLIRWLDKGILSHAGQAGPLTSCDPFGVLLCCDLTTHSIKRCALSLWALISYAPTEQINIGLGNP